MRTWCADSSPETYSVEWPAAPSLAASCRSKVGLPIPGSPPMSTIEPGTTPPPRTKSSSCIPDDQRVISVPVTSRRRVATATLPPPARPFDPFRRRSDPELAAFAAIGSSTSVFHSPQASHLPCHFAYDAPHSEQ